MSILAVEVPRALKPLLLPARYKGAYGGRGGAKSHFFAEQLIARCYARITRAVCIREVQNSLRDSVRQLLIDKIAKLGLSEYFDVLEGEIRCFNGSLIIFRGMQEYNADNIKSLEGFDIAWVEEAQTLSDTSMRMLRPTIRNPGSELWFSWNPRNKTDPVDLFFRGETKHPKAIAVQVSWQDNPWLPDELREEMEHDFAADDLMARHVWGGDYQVIFLGAYYGRLMADALETKRITKVPYEPKLLVTTAWDLGIGDSTSIWFVQQYGKEVRVIDHYKNNGAGLDHYVKLLREKPYAYDQHLLPHDAEVKELGTGMTRVETLQSLGLGPTIIPRQSVEDGIQAVRNLLPRCWFDEERCKDGIEALRQYRAEYDEKLKTIKPRPLHDWASHCADAFRYLALGLRTPADKTKPLAYPKRKVV